MIREKQHNNFDGTGIRGGWNWVVVHSEEMREYEEEEGKKATTMAR